MKYLHNLLESYWNQWTKAYLNELREHRKNRKNFNSIIKFGDIIFIQNHNAKRNVWKLGKVVQLFTSKRSKRSCCNRNKYIIRIHYISISIDPLTNYTHLKLHLMNQLLKRNLT